MTRLVRFALILALTGISATIPVLVQERPSTFVLFSFVGQPLLAASFVLYLATVLQELRRQGLFRG